MLNRPRSIIVRGPGTNCDQETQWACEKAEIRADVIHIAHVLENPKMLEQYHLLIIPGGFSYGDDLGAGKVMGNELRWKLSDALWKFIEQGKLALGVCNGFQILVQAGLLPNSRSKEHLEVTLAQNDSGRFEDRWVYLKVFSSKCPFINEQDIVIELPIAHGEGRFFTTDTKLLERLSKDQQIVLKYVTPYGEEAAYPWNPNGSLQSIAGICDPTGHVLGLMPHPERFSDICQHPRWTRHDKTKPPDGIKFFQNAARYIREHLL